MSWLFEPTIDQSNWGQYFQSIDAFIPLIKSIFEKHDLSFTNAENLTPGTNAVFRVKDKVIKIFAPVESGFYDGDFEIEVESQIHANNSHIGSPKIIFQGIIEDKYLFRYIIMQFIEGQEAEKILLIMSEHQLENFALQLRSITNKLNVAVTSNAIPVLTVTECLNNTRWDIFPESFQNDRKSIIKKISLDNCVYTHGDLTAENIIIGEDNNVKIIDFADSRIAPPFYEWPPIVFALFRCDPIMMIAYFGNYHNDVFYEQLTMSLLVHDFGAGIVRQLCELKNISISSITNVSHLKDFVIFCLKEGKAKVK